MRRRAGPLRLLTCLDHFGDIVIWTVVECGLGITAGSLACLRPLLKKLGLSGKSSVQKSTDPTVTIGGGGRSIGLSAMRAQSKATASRNDEWERIDDDHSSQKFIIMKNTQVDVEWSGENQTTHAISRDGKSF